MASTGTKRLRGKSWQFRAHVGGRVHTSTLPPENGRPVGERRAGQALRAWLGKLEGEHQAAEVGSVDALLDKWWKAASPRWSPSTRAARQSFMNVHVRPRLGRELVAEVTPSMLDDFYADLRTNLAESSVSAVHTHVVAPVFAQAVRWEWIARSPADADRLANPPRPLRREVTPPTPDAVQTLMASAEAQPDFVTALHVTADTGCRRGEVVALQWQDVHLTVHWSLFGFGVGGELVIRRAAVLDGPKVTVKSTKTDKVRRVALHTSTVGRLLVWHAHTLERLDVLSAPMKPTLFVFPADPAGRTPMRPDGITSRFTTIRARCGLTSVRWHDLRHYVASYYLSKGVDPRTVQGRLGWSTLNMLDRYSHFLPAADRTAVDRVGADLLSTNAT